MQCSGDLLRASRACKMQPSDAVGMRIASAVSRTSTSRLQERLTSSRGQIAATAEDRALFPRSAATRFLSGMFLLSFLLRFGAFGCQKAQIFFAGVGAPPQTPSRTHMSYPLRGRAPPENWRGDPIWKQTNEDHAHRTRRRRTVTRCGSNRESSD